MERVFQRKLQVNQEYDVLVAGGGPSGCAAAIAAARDGAKTLLIEGTGALGGMATLGGVPAWCPFSDKEKVIYKGLAEKIFRLTCADAKHIASTDTDWVPIVPETLKRVLDALVTEAGADLLFGTHLSAVESADGNVDYVVLTNKDGLTAYKAKVYIDCTGDGDLAARAGAAFVNGDEENGDMQMATLCFTVANVDMYNFIYGESIYGGNQNSPIRAMLSSGRYPHVTDAHMCASLLGPGVVGFNAGHVQGLDGTDALSLTKGYIAGRKEARDIVDGLREFAPESFGNAFLTATASLMGVRETRRIIGDYVLTAEDYAARRSFPDEIGRCCYFIDMHSKGGSGENDKYPEYGAGESYGIPYRVLTPKGFGNLLTAGRAVSCDRRVLGSIRVMPPAMVTGEAAGAAAALAVQSANIDVHTVDTSVLRENLRKHGAYFI
ncbi:MAG: FAD-dependent oxidoreductase [Clostridiales bacterium]|jgi:hypothetical protein|nr:FAD-dependent oxidoreductase [Clostridiales bacterium]